MLPRNQRKQIKPNEYINGKVGSIDCIHRIGLDTTAHCMLGAIYFSMGSNGYSWMWVNKRYGMMTPKNKHKDQPLFLVQECESYSFVELSVYSFIQAL